MDNLDLRLAHMENFIKSIHKQQRVLLEQLLNFRDDTDKRFDALAVNSETMKEYGENVDKLNKMCEQLCIMNNKRVYSTAELVIMKDSGYSWTKLSEVTGIPVGTLRHRIRKYYERSE